MSAPRRRSRLFTTSAFGALALAALWAAPAHAQLVQGATPAQSNGGVPTIDQSVANTTTVTLGGSRTVIDWDKFDINSGDAANFVFANRSDIVLNRVGGAGSTINGNLNGTIGSTGGAVGGNIWIYNANGVVIGANARVSTGGLLVTTAALDRATDSSAGGFLDGSSTSFNFSGAADGTRIDIQAGAQVNSRGGAIALIAPVIATEAGSSVTASDGGNVLYGSASRYKISFRPTSADDFDLISFEVANGADGAGNSGGSEAIGLGGDTSGNRVFVAAVSKSGLTSSIVNSGTITATNVAADETGAIVLSADHNIVNGAVATSRIANTGRGVIAQQGALAAPAVSVFASGGIALRANIDAAGGTVAFRSDDEIVSQTFGVITADLLTARGGGGLNFNSFHINEVARLGDLTADTGDLTYLGDVDALELTGAISAPGKVTLGARGFIDTTTGSISAGSLEFYLGGGGSFKVLGDANIGEIYANGAVTVEALTGDVKLTNTVNMLLGDTLSLTSGTGSVLQTGGTIEGNGAVVASAGQDIDLSRDNNIVSATLTATSNGTIAVKALGNLSFGGITTGDLTVDAGGSATASGTLDVGEISVRAGGSVDLSLPGQLVGQYRDLTAGSGNVSISSNATVNLAGDVSASGTVSVQSGAGAVRQTAGTIRGNNVYLSSATGAIDQDAGASLHVGNWLEAHANTDLLLRGANDLGYQDAYLTAGTGKDVTIRSIGDYRYNSYGITLGTLTLISDAGSIRQGSGIYADTLIARAATGLRLDGGGVGNTVTTVGGLSTASGDITFTEGNGFDIAGDISAPGLVQLGTSGTITSIAGRLSAGTLEVTAGGGASIDATGNIRLAAISTFGGGNFYLGTDGDIELTGAINTGGSNLILSTTNGAITTNGGTISAYVTTAEATGAITLVGSGFATFWATSTGGDITLSGDSDVFFMVNTPGDLTVTAAGYAGNNSDVYARSVGITAGSGIQFSDQVVSINIGSYRYLLTDGYIDIENKGDINLDGNVTANGSDPGNSIRLKSSQNSILQNSGTISGYSVQLEAAQSITQDAAAKVVAGDYGLGLTATDVTLIGANVFPWLTSYTVSRDLTLRAVGTLDMSGSSNQAAGGARNITLISDTGDILGGYVEADKLTATAANGKLVFNYGNNRIRGLGALTAKSTTGTDIDIFTDSALGLTGDISGGGVRIYATGGIDQTAGAITADRLFTGTAAYLLLGGANDFGALLDFGHANGATVTIRNRGDLALPSTANSFGALTLTSDTGGVSQAGAITALTLNIQAATGIDLSNNSNNFTTLAGLAITGASGDIRIGDTSGFTIEGNISAANGLVALRSTGAITTGTTTVNSVMTPHGKIDADTLSIGGGTSATLWTAGDIRLGAISLSSGLTLTADNNIELTGTLAAVGTSLNAVAGSITENGGKINVTTGAFVATGAITLGGDNRITNFNATSNGGGNLTFNNGGTGASVVYLNTTGDAAVTIGGNLTTGGITAADLSATAGSIDLTNNVSVNSFSKLIASTGEVNVTNAHGFALAGDVSSTSQIRMRTANGAITQTAGTITGGLVALQGSGDVTQSGTAAIHAGVSGASFTGANLDLRGNNQFAGDISIQTPGNLQLNGDRLRLGFVAPAVDVTLTATGDITSAGAIQASSLTATAGGQIDLEDPANAIGTIHGLSGTSVAFSNSTGFIVDGDVTAWTGNVFLDATTDDLRQTAGTISGGGVSLYADAGSVVQSGTGRVLASSLLGVIATGDILLGGANDFNYAASGFRYGTGRNVTIRNLGGINFAVGTNGSIDALSLTSDIGAITQSGAVTANSFAASAATGITFANAANNIARVNGLANSISGGINYKNSGNYQIGGDITAAGQTVTLASVNGYFAQDFNNTTAALLNLSANGVVRLHGTVDALGTITNPTNYVILALTGDVALTGNIQASNFQLTTTGNINQTGGAINAGDLYLAAASTITALGNNDVDTVQLKATGTGAIQFNSLGNLVVKDGTANGTGLLDIRASGDIFIDAQIVGLFANELALHAGGDISVHQYSDMHVGTVTGLVSDTGDIEYRDYRGIALDGNVRAAGAVTLISYLNGMGGAVTQQSGTITAGTLNLQAGTQGANLSQGNHVANLGDVNAGSGFTLRNADDLSVTGTINVGTGQLTLFSAGTLKQVGAAPIFAGSLLASAATGLSLSDVTVSTLKGLSSTTGGIAFGSTTNLTLDGDIDSGTASTALDANGAIIQQSGIITAGSLGLNASGDIDLAKQNQVGSLSAVNTGGYFHFTNTGDIVIGGGWNVGTDIALTSGGAISQTAGVGASTFSASAVNGIRLDYFSNEIGAFGTLSNSGAGGIYLADNASFTVTGDITAAGQTVELYSNGWIAQSGGTTITAAQLRSTATTSLSFTSVTNNVGEIGLLGSLGGVAFTNANGFSLTGDLYTIGGEMRFTSVAGGITQTDGTLRARNLVVDAAGSITLDRANNNIGSSTASTFSTSAGDIRFHSANAILLGAVSTPGLLSLATDAGGITQTTGITAARLSATSTTGDIVLDQSNAIGTVGNVSTNGSFTLNVAGNLTLDGTITAPDLVQITADGDITQIGTGGIHSDLLQATSGSGAVNGISLLNQNNVAQAQLDSHGKDLRFRNTGDFELGNISAAGHIVEMISEGGAVTQLAGTSIVAGTFSATGTNVVLDNVGNQISRIGLISTGSDLSLRNTVALQIDRIDAAGHAVTINNGDNITGGNITADTLTIGITGGYVDLSTANHVASLGGFNGTQLSFTNAESFTLSGAIQNGMYQSFLTSQNGSITMAGGAVNSGGLTVQAATGIALTGSMSNIYGAASTTGDVSLISSMMLDIQGDISGDTVTLGGTANGGYVGQTSGSITANLLNASGNAYVDLSGATNHIAALGTVISNGDITVSSLDGVTLTGNIDSGRFVTITAGGAVSQTGGRIQGWGLTVTAAGDLDLGATNLIVNNGDVMLAGDNVTFANDGTFTVAGITAASIGAIDLRSINGSIVQSGAMRGGSLTASAHGALTLGQANTIGTVGALSAGTDLTYAASGTYDLTDDITAGGSVTLNGNSGINQTGGTITADMLNVSAGSADLQGANAVAQLGTIITAGDFSFRNIGDIELWGTVNVGARFGLHSDTGGVSNPGGLYTTNILDVTAAGDIDLNGGTLNYLDTLVSQNGNIALISGSRILGGTLISAENGWVDMTVNGITAGAVRTGRLSIDATGADVELLGDNDIVQLAYIFGDNISLAVGESAITGWLHGTNSIAFTRSGIAGNFALAMGSSNGAITTNMLSLSNTGTAGTAALSNITTGAGPLELNLNFNGNAAITANTSAISLNNAIVDGDLSLSAGGAITNTGAGADISGTLNASTSTGNIVFAFATDRVGHFGTISSPGAVALGAANVDMTGAVSGVSFRADAGAGSVTQAAGSTITSGSAEGTATGDLLLTGANTIGMIGSLSAGNDLTVRTSGALQIVGMVDAGANADMSLIAGGDISFFNMGSLSGGTLSITAPGHVVDLSTRPVAFNGLGNVTAGTFNFYNTGNLDLSGSVAADAISLQSSGRVTQSAGSITAGSLAVSGSNGFALDQQNQVGTLSATNSTGDAISFSNAGDLEISGALSNAGDIALNVTGDLTAASGISSGGLLTLTANGIATSGLQGDAGVSVTGGAHALNLGSVASGDDVSVTGTGNLTVASIGMTGLTDLSGDGFNVLLSGGEVTLGAASGPITGANFLTFDPAASPGSVTVQATGNATVRLDDTSLAMNITAGGNVNAQANGQLLLGDVSGANVTLRAATNLAANSISTPGVYSVTAGDIGAGAFNILGGNPLDILITDTAGDLTLTGTIAARRNTTVTAAGNVLGSAAHLGAGLTMDGTLAVNGGDIALAEASSFYDVVLNATGDVDVGTVGVGRAYALTGRNFLGNTLVPMGTRSGTWTLTGLTDLDLLGATLQYNGGIDFHVAGMLSNGTVQSLTGAVTGSAGVIDVYELLAATDIDASSTAGAFHIFHANAGTGALTLRGQLSLTVDGSVEAAGNVGLTAQFGPTTIGYASAGGNISVFSLFGNATLRQATLTGTTGNLTVQSATGTATLGAADYASIGTDNYFERAAGSTGTVSVVGAGHAKVHLDHSATLDLIRANTVLANVLSGDLSIDTLAAVAGDAGATTGTGSLFVNSVEGSAVILEAGGGNLTLGGGGITASGVFLTAAGILDTTAISDLSVQDLALVGGTIRAASLTATGDAHLSSTNGGITMNNLTVGGEVFVSALGNLTMNQVSAGDFSNFVADGDLTVRSVTAHNGFWLTGQGNVTLGADAGTLATSDNYIEVGGTLGNCGCSTGGATILSLGGNVSVNLLSATGVFDGVSANAGNVSLSIGSGDLGIGALKGHDITASAPGLLTVMNAQSSGGSYSLTAADFGASALSPSLFGGATGLGDVTIIDTDGDLHSAGALSSSGNIRVEAQGGAITGGLTLSAAGDVTAIGQGVTLQQVSGRDVSIDAGTGTAGITNMLSVERDYTLSAGGFAGNILSVGGSRAGSLAITAMAGDINQGGANLSFGGSIRVRADHGAVTLGDLHAGTGLDIAGAGVATGVLRTDIGSLNVASTLGIDVAAAHGVDVIQLQADGDLRLGGASLTGSGANIFRLIATGGLVFGADNGASITGDHVFTSNSADTTNALIRADGNLTINLLSSANLGVLRGGDTQIAVRSGDFIFDALGATGAVNIEGPAGVLKINQGITAGTNNVGIVGQGALDLGDITTLGTVSLMAQGTIAFGTVRGDTVSVLTAGGITGNSVIAHQLDIAAGANAIIGNPSYVDTLGTVAVTNGDFLFYNHPALVLGGNVEVANGTVTLYSDNGITQAGGTYITARRLQGSAGGAVALNNGNLVGTLGQLASNGFSLHNTIALAIDGDINAGGGAAVIASHGGMTITANGQVRSTASGDAITLASDGLFTNLAGADALQATNGRWLVYTQAAGNTSLSDPNNNFGGLAGTSYYGDAYNFGTLGFTSAPNAGNRFVYGYRPVLTVTPSSAHVTYDGTTPLVTATITGLVNGDSAANAYSGAAEISGVGSNAGTYFAYSALGTLASEMGYTFAFTPGTVIIDPRVISVVLNANDRTYDGTTAATGALTLNGVIAGDTVSVSAASLAFDDRNAGTRTVTASGITLSGASAGNYIVSATATDLADIMARAITAMLTANGRAYDGTTDATGTLVLNGLLGNDQVNVSGSAFAFDSKNAGTRTVTASGITLSGNDAGNYTVNVSATDLADILARAITATLTANDRTYDGTTAATGTLSLSGVLGNDQVGANGSLAFDGKNAGTGRTVTASGIALSGADAGNYIVNASATDLADILAKAITATLNANDRSYDGTLAATGTLSLNGVVSGDSVAAGAASLLFDNKNAGTGRTVTANGITLSGGDAGNYTVNTSATDLADILARAITATLAANGRVYDGTSIATGTLSLNGVLSGDQVSVSAGSIAFDSKNAGSRTATASGLVLGGGDAANYTVSGTATGTATIAQRAITATATADSHVYDGTTATTGRIALSGVISGDTVTGTASYRFADANAGTGRAVQVSGLGLSGADAANYTVTLSATPVTADIIRRAVTITVQDATKILGQPDPVFGYAVSSGSVVNGDAFTGALGREAGDQAGRYAIGQGTLALSANYLLTVVPGTLVISFTQSGAEASDALKMLQAGVGTRFSVNQDPSRNLEGDGGQGAGGDGDK